MLTTVTGLPTVVALDLDHNDVEVDLLVDTLKAVIKFDPKIVDAARKTQPDLQLWDIVDVGGLIDYSGSIEGAAVVYSPILMGKKLTITSEEVMFAVLDYMNTYHMKKARTPLNWDVVEKEYQFGFDDHEVLDDLRDAFVRWDAQRQRAAIASELPKKQVSKKKQKM